PFSAATTLILDVFLRGDSEAVVTRFMTLLRGLWHNRNGLDLEPAPSYLAPDQLSRNINSIA
ncbi:hypothetical protein A2U01_0035610, partial [Trifolium medium]|nr:hypothetical protein [Trifolium medium]